MNSEDTLFAVLCEAAEYEKPLILHNLTFERLMDDLLVPYEKDESFFIDGAPISREKVKRLKILRQGKLFNEIFFMLHHNLRFEKAEVQKVLGEQYYVRLEAIFRQNGEDVTSQVIKAFNEKIRPSLADYLSKRMDLIQAAMKFFFDSIRVLGGSS